MLTPDLLGRDQSLVGVGGGHADVGDRHVGPAQGHLSEQAVGIAGLAHHLDGGVPQQADDPLAGEHRVVGDDYAHGIRARSRPGPASSVPPSAPILSSTCSIAPVRGPPSSSTSTTSAPSSAATRASAWVAPRSAASPIASLTAKYAAISTGAG